eukprot:505153-Hanusia_phi.AAC.2
MLNNKDEPKSAPGSRRSSIAESLPQFQILQNFRPKKLIQGGSERSFQLDMKHQLGKASLRDQGSTQSLFD